jgi:hypothetical protein
MPPSWALVSVNANPPFTRVPAEAGYDTGSNRRAPAVACFTGEAVVGPSFRNANQQRYVVGRAIRLARG